MASCVTQDVGVVPLESPRPCKTKLLFLLLLVKEFKRGFGFFSSGSDLVQSHKCTGKLWLLTGLFQIYTKDHPPPSCSPCEDAELLLWSLFQFCSLNS